MGNVTVSRNGEVEIAVSEEPEEVFTFKIAGFTDDNYYGDMNSGTPIMIVSSKWLEETAQSLHQTEHLYVSKLNIQYNKEYDKHADKYSFHVFCFPFSVLQLSISSRYQHPTQV